MATFSPSPAPRRTLRRPAGSPPVGSRRIRLGSSKPTSRLTTPLRAERRPPASDIASGASGMEVDEGSVVYERGVIKDTLLAKSEERTVSFHAHIPLEVKQVLRNADFIFGDPYTGEIDTLSGFALVASVQTCFVWQHAQSLKGIPTCYIFSCPRDYNSQKSPPFHSLVPYASAREPGLILISHSGEIRFWDSIGIGLAGGDHFLTTSLELGDEENLTNLIRADLQTYVAATTTGRLFRLTLTSTGGKYHLTSHTFSRLQSSLSLSRLLPSLWTTASNTLVPESGNISALALGQTSVLGTDVWALVDTRVQKWKMSAEGWEEALLDEDLAETIRPAIRKAFKSVSPDDSALDLELVDLALESTGRLVVLVSYAGHEDSAMDLGGIRRIFALSRISLLAGSFKVDTISSVPYQSISNSGAPMHPRLQLIHGGSLVSIQFGDAVALCARDSEYRDRLELKSNMDRTLGVGILDGESSLLILTATAIIKAYVDMQKVNSFDPETGRAHMIRSIMTQAILYGSSPENPLHFSFPPEVDEESLMNGAEQLSRAVLESDSEVVRRNHDLNAQLAGRKDRLSWLIQFINDNTVLLKMSQQSRQRLATDAEKLYASHQLWQHYNEFLSAGHSQLILKEAVLGYMEDVGEGDHEDVMRAFFRLRVRDIGSLLPKLMEALANFSQDGEQVLEVSIAEANSVVVTLLQSAFDYREHNLGVYGIELPMRNPWTSRPQVIDIVSGLFDFTTRLVESTSTDPDAVQAKAEPSSQLPQLASVLFACVQERLDWLDSPAASDEAGVESEKNELEDKFSKLRPDVLETLRKNNYSEPAFKLAESYRDFRSLAYLCHKETVYPPENNPNCGRIQMYVERFGEDFTTELYRWYIEHGELRVMFAQKEAIPGDLDRFFANNPYTAISWIHDLGKAQYSAAAKALLSESEHVGDLQTKHLMLSIGKLSHLAQLHEQDINGDGSLLDAFHDGLDFVSVHQTLVRELKSKIQSSRSRQSLDAQVEMIVRGQPLSDKSGFQLVFRQLVRQLLQGKTLSVEDMVDVLTLKDNTTSVDDFATALHLLAHVTNVPDARRLAACRTVWRRIYIHDDWGQIRKTSNITDSALNERFQGTALYIVLSAVPPKPHQPEGYDLDPNEAFTTPTTYEISSRWPGMSPDQVEALSEDYQLERDRLIDLALEDVYHRVRELVMNDITARE